MTRTSAEIICDTLEQLGGTTVFGMPGTQNVQMFEALRGSKLKTIVTTNESAAAFAANGYYRACGKVGVLTTIPGPGFTFALSGLAEALLDSVALLHIVSSSGDGSDRSFQHQHLDLAAIARPLVKEVLVVSEISRLAEAVARGYLLAESGEPGPVLLLFDKKLFQASFESGSTPRAISTSPVNVKVVEEVAEIVASANRIALFAGQGGQSAAQVIQKLAERFRAAVLTTNSGRGVISENDPRSLYYDYSSGGGDSVNEFITQCDLVLALGCKFSHNGSGGFALRIPPEKLIHIDASKKTLNANYPARLAVQADLGPFLESLVGKITTIEPSKGWSTEALDPWRARFLEEESRRLRNVPTIAAGSGISCEQFFAALRQALPNDCILVTDSGLHQVLTRRYFSVRTPRGLITPSDFQSMGFGIPAAIGATVAAPNRRVVLVIGDGGMAISGLELLTAVRAQLNLTVIVFNDGYLNLIRTQQIDGGLGEHGTALMNPDFAVLAESIGAGYDLLGENVTPSISSSMTTPGVNLLEVLLGDAPGLATARMKGKIKRHVRKIVRPAMLSRLKSRFRGR